MLQRRNLLYSESQEAGLQCNSFLLEEKFAENFSTKFYAKWSYYAVVNIDNSGVVQTK